MSMPRTSIKDVIDDGASSGSTVPTMTTIGEAKPLVDFTLQGPTGKHAPIQEDNGQESYGNWSSEQWQTLADHSPFMRNQHNLLLELHGGQTIVPDEDMPSLMEPEDSPGVIEMEVLQQEGVEVALIELSGSQGTSPKDCSVNEVPNKLYFIGVVSTLGTGLARGGQTTPASGSSGLQPLVHVPTLREARSPRFPELSTNPSNPPKSSQCPTKVR
ncbi:hypothetical protein B0H10DRAFT_1940584 [Mycena sp. CBHHK59/15]|nr:hypothetical protein B0H10DRAFT_1940584 [Mycena sp. CBHHK59/15]